MRWGNRRKIMGEPPQGHGGTAGPADPDRSLSLTDLSSWLLEPQGKPYP